MTRLFLLACAFVISFRLSAQDQPSPSPIIFIYDASGSMWGQMDGKTKMEIASGVLSDAVHNLGEQQKVSLVAYGHREKGDCRDVEFLVDIDNRSKEKVTQAVKAIKPLGKTPLAYSATMVFDKLRSAGTKATVILVTDGIESCDGNICEVVQKAKEEGIDFRLHIIGFGLKAEETEQLRCAADAGDGQYYDAADAGGLSDVLHEATATSVDDPLGNFSVYAVKNGEPIDAWVRAFKAGTREEVDQTRTYRDTSFLSLPQGRYDLEVKPLENSDVAAIFVTVESKSDALTHQTLSFDGGKIRTTVSNNGEGWDGLVRVLDQNTNKQIAATRTYGGTKEMEVNPGTYDIEFTALVIEGVDIKFKIENVEVTAGGLKELNHDFKSGTAMIGVKTATELIDATVNLKELNSGNNVAAGRTYVSESSNPRKFILSPGEYSVTVVTLGKHKGNKETFQITVNEGETLEKIITY